MSDFTGHTPGPWFAVERTTNPQTYSVGVQVPIKGNLLTTHYIAHVSDGRKSAEADAMLIAAAPDLLAERDKLLEIIAELIWVEDTIDGFADDEPLWDDMVELDRRQKAVWEVARKELQEAKECN